MPHINRLNDFQFLEKFVLFERSEFTNFSLRKLKQSEEERFNWGVFFATFLHKQESRNTKNTLLFSVFPWRLRWLGHLDGNSGFFNNV